MIAHQQPGDDHPRAQSQISKHANRTQEKRLTDGSATGTRGQHLFRQCSFSPQMEIRNNAKPHRPDRLASARTAHRAMGFVGDPAEASDKSPERPAWTNVETLQVEDLDVTSSTVPKHPMQHRIASDDRLNLPKPSAATTYLLTLNMQRNSISTRE